MKALTLYQPWASLVAIGAKRIETRSWNTKYRGPLAIHVSKRKEIDHLKWWSEPWASALQGTLVKIDTIPVHLNKLGISGTRYEIIKENLHYGCVIATCELIHVTRVPSDAWLNNLTEIGYSLSSWKISEQELAFGDFSAGRYLWLLNNVKMLPEPVAARGAMGLWEWMP